MRVLYGLCWVNHDRISGSSLAIPLAESSHFLAVRKCKAQKQVNVMPFGVVCPRSS